MNDRLKVGIALDGLVIPAWKYELVQKIIKHSAFELGSMLLCEKEHIKKNPFELWKVHANIDRMYFKPQPDAFNLVDSNQLLRDIEVIENLNEQTTKSARLDYVLWLSSAEVPVWIYQQLSVGVLYFINGAQEQTTEAFLGYQAFMKMSEVITSALVLRANDDLPGQIIYRTWSMMPSLSMSRSRNEHMWKLVSLGIRALKGIASEGGEVFCAQLKEQETTNIKPGQVQEYRPGFFLAAWNMLKHFNRMAYKALRKMGYQEQWILLLNTINGASTSFTDFKKIIPPKDRFWADPFLIKKEGRQYLFFEELPFATDKGHLSVMEVMEDGTYSKAVTILEKPYHLSYPFIFEVAGVYYMIPESYQDKSIQIYECTSFPFEWEHKMNLMSGVSAFDTTLYFYDGKWWLFTLMAEQEGGGHNDELFLFYSDTPFTTNWKSHPQNPIVSDVRVARPAGNIYEENGKLIRPSQDCARKYGYGFNLNEIEVLTTTEYREKNILHIRPDWDNTLTRTHSFNHAEGMTVIDAVIQRSRFF